VVNDFVDDLVSSSSDRWNDKPGISHNYCGPFYPSNDNEWSLFQWNWDRGAYFYSKFKTWLIGEGGADALNEKFTSPLTSSDNSLRLSLCLFKILYFTSQNISKTFWNEGMHNDYTNLNNAYINTNWDTSLKYFYNNFFIINTYNEALAFNTAGNIVDDSEFHKLHIYTYGVNSIGVNPSTDKTNICQYLYNYTASTWYSPMGIVLFWSIVSLILFSATVIIYTKIDIK
jgi:hypothetical protein